MTPEQRAEKVLDKLTIEHGDEVFVSAGYAYYADAITRIASEIRAAVEDERQKQMALSCETIQREIKNSELVRSEAWRGGRREAYEDAAKIAEANEHQCESPFPPQQAIAEDIRARAKEVSERWHSEK